MVNASPDVISGDVVRDLVDRNEQEIGALQDQLDTALQETADAEWRVAALSGATPMAQPSVDRTPAPGTKVAADRRSSTLRPRTTVVARPCTTGVGGVDARAGEDGRMAEVGVGNPRDPDVAEAPLNPCAE